MAHKQSELYTTNSPTGTTVQNNLKMDRTFMEMKHIKRLKLDQLTTFILDHFVDRVIQSKVDSDAEREDEEDIPRSY